MARRRLPAILTSAALTGTGHADAFADVVDVNGDGVINALDGAWAALLDGNWFFVDTNGDGTFGGPGERRDIRFGNSTNGLASWDTAGTDIVGLRSNDPGRVFTVPEPSTLGILSVGLLALGFTLRRRRKLAA